MNDNGRISRTTGIGGTVVLALLLITVLPLQLFGHGGKTHTDTEFTNFQALQKSIRLYDKLLTSGKLDEVWETGLTAVDISTRKESGGDKVVVKYVRSGGAPDTLFVFYNTKGEYAGANFTGE